MKARTRPTARRKGYGRRFGSRRGQTSEFDGHESKAEEQGRGVSEQELELRDLFAAAEGREDRWQVLNSLAQQWRDGIRPEDRLRDQTSALLKELEPLETFWAFPGTVLLS